MIMDNIFIKIDNIGIILDNADMIMDKISLLIYVDMIMDNIYKLISMYRNEWPSLACQSNDWRICQRSRHDSQRVAHIKLLLIISE